MKNKEEKVRRLKLNTRPKADLTVENRLKPNEELFENIKKRMHDLAEILFHLKTIYKNDKNLYSDDFLAFVGHIVIRNWPYKDFPFTSKNARKILESYSITTGLTKSQLDKEIKDKVTKNLTYEHFTPIGQIRHYFENEDFSIEQIYKALINDYRIVLITKEEDKSLNKKHKTNRDLDTYKNLDIEICDEEKELWKEFYGDDSELEKRKGFQLTKEE